MFTVCFRSRSTIQFREVCNLAQVILNYPVEHSWPGTLCSVSPTTLLYEDSSAVPPAVQWLHCRDKFPKSGHSFKTQVFDINHMFVFEDQSKQLLVTANQSEVHVYNTYSAELVWKMRGQLPGHHSKFNLQSITTCGVGHLFVCDGNNHCVEMFSVADGKYLGAVLKQGKQSLGEPKKICWSEHTCSLIVAHCTDGEWSISSSKFK